MLLWIHKGNSEDYALRRKPTDTIIHALDCFKIDLTLTDKFGAENANIKPRVEKIKQPHTAIAIESVSPDKLNS